MRAGEEYVVRAPRGSGHAFTTRKPARNADCFTKLRNDALAVLKQWLNRSREQLGLWEHCLPLPIAIGIIGGYQYAIPLGLKQPRLASGKYF